MGVRRLGVRASTAVGCARQRAVQQQAGMGVLSWAWLARRWICYHQKKNSPKATLSGTAMMLVARL